MAYQKTAPKRYFLEVVAALVLMFAAGWVHGFVIHHTKDPGLITATALLPLLPILLAVTAVWRLYRGSDEFQRQTLLKTTAGAAMVSLLFFMLFPILNELLHLPLLPPRFPLGLVVLTSSYILVALVLSFLGKRVEVGAGRALLQLAPFLLLLLVPPAYWLASMVVALPRMTFWLHVFLFVGAGIGLSFYQIFVRRQTP